MADLTATVTCHTTDCGNADIPLVLTVGGTDEGGNAWAVGSVVCGVCGFPIDDIEPPLPEQPEPEPQEGSQP